jgi:hypothetical protein
MKVDNMVVTTTKETTNSIVQLTNCMEKLGYLFVHMVEQMRNGWTCGYDDIWMNEEDKSASKPLTNNNYFHVEVHERSHHEMNGVLKKSEHSIQK